MLLAAAASLLAGPAQAAPPEHVLGSRAATLRPSGVKVRLVVSELPGTLRFTLQRRSGGAWRRVKRVRAPFGWLSGGRLVSITSRPSTEPDIVIFTIRIRPTGEPGDFVLDYAATATSLVGPVQ